MKFPAALLLSLTISVSAEPLNNDIIRSAPGPGGKQLAWYVTEAEWARAPKWVFDGKSPAPLPLSDAYPKAYDSIRKRFPKSGDFHLYRYSLNEFSNTTAPNGWYYTFDFFMPRPRGTEVRANESFGPWGVVTVVVLMDGTVIEPREEELKR